MPARLRKREELRPSLQIAPMIDCVFLLLIYFMVSSTMQKQEADIAFQLPGTVAQSEALDVPDEQVVEITAEDAVIVNGYACGAPGAGRLAELAGILKRFREACASARTEAAVTIAPAGGSSHQAVIRVMDACAAAGIGNVQFSIEPED